MAESARSLEAALWTAAGIVAGARVLDLGCGPGATLAALAEVVGPAGSVHGVDQDPAAVETANALVVALGRTNASASAGDLLTWEAPGAPADVAVMRHVLAHNGPVEHELVTRVAALVRPGGSVYLVDVDSTCFRRRPEVPLLAEMWDRYRAFHAARGNDLQVGLRLVDLLRDAGLEIVVDTAVMSVSDVGLLRGSIPWAARDAMLAAGVIDAEDLARWQRGLDQLDAAGQPVRFCGPAFVAVGRRPGGPER